MTDGYPKSFDLRKYFYAFIANSIVRVVGMIMRSVLIVIGLSCYVLLALAYPLALIIWLILPLFIITLIGTGLFLVIFK